jgi:Gpi18-like mannosyltransferase
MHINLHPGSPISTPWWVLLALTLVSAVVNFSLVLGITQLRIQPAPIVQPLLQLAAQYNPDQQPVEHPFALREFFYKWDSYYYVEIAQNGYTRQSFSEYKRQNWAFFPLYPALIGAIANISGQAKTPETLLAIGIILSNIFLFLGLLVWKKLAVALKMTPVQWWIFLVTIFLFPLSYVFHFVFTESLFFFLSSLALWLTIRHRYITASWIIGLTAITRITGIFLLPLLLGYYWLNHARHKHLRTELPYIAGMSIIALTPLWLFLTYLQTITGELLAPLKIQSAWDNASSLPFATFLGYFNDYGLTFQPEHGLSILLLLGCWALLIYQAVKLRRLPFKRTQAQWLLWTFSLILVLVNSSINNRSSIFRYTLSIPYLFVILAQLQQTKWRWGWLIPLWTIFAVLHVLFLAFFLLQIPAYGF